MLLAVQVKNKNTKVDIWAKVRLLVPYVRRFVLSFEAAGVDARAFVAALKVWPEPACACAAGYVFCARRVTPQALDACYNFVDRARDAARSVFTTADTRASGYAF